MERAIDRCLRAAPVRDLSEFRSTSGTVALRCAREGCVECRSFDADGRIGFEQRLRAARVIPWDCDVDERRELAARAGVDKIPAYVLVAPSGEVSVRYP